ncbi:nSTAND1 domain-containing NTPase [Nonomuraea rubra]
MNRQTSPERYLALVLGGDRRPVGLAFAAGPRELVTCAHVVNTALDRDRTTLLAPAKAWIQVEFPFAGEPGQRVVRSASISRWMPVEGVPFELRDVAGLQLEENLPRGAEPATLVSAKDGPAGERRVGAWGPNLDGGRSRTGSVVGALIGPYDQARVQMNEELTGVFRVQRGYSGGPVWDQSTGQVVGIVQAVPRNDQAQDVYVISAETLVHAWPDVLYRPPPNPYRGLRAFGEEDAPFFFGREDFVTELMADAEERPLIVVAGRSGSGKSSVLAAGLVPRLQREHTLAVGSFRPGDDPMPRLAGALAHAAGSPSPYPLQDLRSWQDRVTEDGLARAAPLVCAATNASRLLLIIDQFEQLFTECGPDQRAALIDVLNRLLTEPSRTVHVAVGLRSDFYHLLVEAPDPLGTYAKNFWHHLRPMTADELHRAIAEPARMADEARPVTFDDGLVELISDDFEGRPGDLPLLEFTLTRLWELQRGRKLTLQAYRALGSVHGTLAQYAEQRFDALTAAQQEAAQRIFTALLQPDDPEIARQVRRADLRAGDWPTAKLLRDARLLAITRTTHGEQIVEIAHEALLRGWERLREWAESGREFRLWKAGVIAHRQRWENHHRDPDQLLRGSALSKALHMAAGHHADIEGIAQYISLSKEHADSEQAARSRLSRRAAATNLARQSQEALAAGADGHPLALALGILSLQTVPTFDGDLALRAALRLAGRPRRRFPHDDEVCSVAFNPDGTRLATAGDCTARIWDADTGNAIVCVTHLCQLHQVTFSPDGTRLATASDDYTAGIWDTATGRKVAVFVHDGPVQSVAFSPNGRRVATASVDGTARIWDVRSEASITSLIPPYGRVLSVAFNADGTQVATGSDDRTVRVFDIASGVEVSRMRGDFVRSVMFSADGARLATAGDDRTARVWDMFTEAEITRLTHGGKVRSVVFSADRRRLATASEDHTARVWDAATGTEIARLTHDRAVSSVAFSPDGTQVATGGDDRLARIWDTTAGAELTRLTTPTPVSGMVFSADGARLTAASRTGTTLVWDLVTGNEITRRTHGGYSWPMALSRDGTRQATADNEGMALVRDVATGAEVTRCACGAPVSSMAFGMEGTRLATARIDGVAQVWDAATGDEIARLAHAGSVWSVAFSRDGTRLATADIFGTARVWDIVTGNETTRVTHDGPVWSVAFDADGTRLATASADDTARVWDTATGGETARLAHDGDVHEVVFSLDDTRLATAGDDRTARVWDAATGDEIARLSHGEPVRSVAFDSDGTRLATAAGTMHIWVLDTPGLIAQALERLTANLTREQWNRYMGPDVPYRLLREDLDKG